MVANRMIAASEGTRHGELKNRVALVTGGSRGIGRAITLALANTGVAVAVNYRERSTDAETLVEDIRLRGGRAEAICGDVSVSTDVRRMMSQIEDSLGRVDILINNAGVAAGRESEITEADFDRTIASNLKSAFLCTQAVLPAMRARRWGRIVNISAMGARAGSLSVVYGASKAGLEGLTRAYALQLASCGVTVNAVAPGLIDTEMTRDLIETGSALARIPAGRAGTGDEIAQAVVFLIADSYITGQTVAINGGAFFS